MSTNITELLYNFAMNFFIKAPTLFSSAYIFIKTTNIKCSKSKLALLLTAFFVVNIISSVVLLFDNSLGFLASCILFIVTITLFTKKQYKKYHFHLHCFNGTFLLRTIYHCLDFCNYITLYIISYI